MLIIPELETVVILPPRTGSRTIISLVPKRYPKAMTLYRHMEADGVPHGYDRWRRVGLVRPPLQRMWSLYKFLGTFGSKHEGALASSDAFGTNAPAFHEEVKAEFRHQVDRPFEDWLLNNDLPFTGPYGRQAAADTFQPKFDVLHYMPENRKSQFLYLRPDLGVEVFDYREMGGFLRDVLKVGYERRHNASRDEPMPEPTAAMMDHCEKYFAWDVVKTQAF